MKILKDIDESNVVFLDIETVGAVKELTEHSPLWASWSYKNKHGREPIGADDIVKSYAEQAALYPEFGKVVCITIGKIKDNILKLKSYASDDELQLLTDLTTALNNIVSANKKTVLCGHSIKGFDLPWLIRRCIVNQVPLPAIIDTADLKPWNIPHIDTMELWKGSAFNGASLIAIAVALGLHNPKDELEGYQTHNTYYYEPDGLAKIADYCAKDVLTVANIFRRCRYEQLVTAEAGEIKVKKVGVLNKVFNSGVMGKDEQGEILRNYNKLNDIEKVLADEILATVKTK